MAEPSNVNPEHQQPQQPQQNVNVNESKPGTSKYIHLWEDYTGPVMMALLSQERTWLSWVRTCEYFKIHLHRIQQLLH